MIAHQGTQTVTPFCLVKSAQDSPSLSLLTDVLSLCRKGGSEEEELGNERKMGRGGRKTGFAQVIRSFTIT